LQEGGIAGRKVFKASRPQGLKASRPQGFKVASVQGWKSSIPDVLKGVKC
jgi:hypothetical protein